MLRHRGFFCSLFAFIIDVFYKILPIAEQMRIQRFLVEFLLLYLVRQLIEIPMVEMRLLTASYLRS